MIFNKNILLILIFPLFLTSCHYRQDVKNIYIRGKIDKFTGLVYLYKEYAGNLFIIDTIIVDKGGSFIYNIPNNFSKGIYELRWGARNLKYMTFILDSENIVFKANNTIPPRPIFSNQSPSNVAYKTYRIEKERYEKRLDALSKFIQDYTIGDQFYKKSLTQFKKLQNNYNNLITDLSKRFPNSFLSSYLQSDRIPSYPPAPTSFDHNRNKYQVALSNIDFTDSTLLHSNLFNKKYTDLINLIHYLSNNETQQFSYIINLADRIISSSKSSRLIYDYSMSFVLSRLLNNQHLSLKHYQVLEEYMKTFSPILPDYVTISYSTGKYKPLNIRSLVCGTDTLELKDISSEYTLLCFWSSEDSYSKGIIEELLYYYTPYLGKSFQVVSLVSSNQLPQDANNKIFHYEGSDKQYTELIRQLNIRYTPTFWVLDKNKTLVYNPINLFDLNNYFFNKICL